MSISAEAVTVNGDPAGSKGPAYENALSFHVSQAFDDRGNELLVVKALG